MSLIGNGFINKRCRKLLKMFFQMDKIKDKESEKVMIICLIAELISLMLSNSIKIMSHYFPDSIRVNTNKVKFDLTNYATKNYIYIYIMSLYIIYIYIYLSRCSTSKGIYDEYLKTLIA